MATTEKTTPAKKASAAPKATAAKAPAAKKPATPKTTTVKTAAPKAAGKTGTQTGPQVTVVQTKSSAGRIKSQQQTLLGLGLGRIGKTKTLTATPSVQGMIDKVAHLIAVKQSA